MSSQVSYSRKCFGDLWRPPPDLRKCNFGWLWFKNALKWPWDPKNHTRGAFGTVESDWLLEWPLSLLTRIAMTLEMSARTYKLIWSHVKKFLRYFKVGPLISKGLSIVHFKLKMSIKLQKKTLPDAFWSAEIDWDVVRSRRLLLWIVYGLRMSARTYNVIPSSLQNFLETFEHSHLISENSILTGFGSKMLWNDHETLKITREARLEL